MSLFLFDIDGTLLQGLGPYETSLEKAIEQTFGKEIKVDLTHFHGLTDRKILYELLKQANLNLDEKSIDKCLDAFGRAYTASHNETFMYPGVKFTLRELRDRSHVLGVVTGNIEEMARKKLELYSLNEYLPFGAFGQEGYQKVELVNIALARAKNYRWNGNKDHAYAIGDTTRDIEAGVNAGIKTIGVTIAKKATEEQFRNAGANQVIKNLDEILTISQ